MQSVMTDNQAMKTLLANKDLWKIMCQFLTTIQEAAHDGNLAVLKALCSVHGAKPWEKNNAALIAAAYNGHLDAVKLLWPLIKDQKPELLDDDDINPPEEDYRRAISAATDAGHADVVQFLCSVFRFKPTFANNTALQTAIEHGNLHIVQILWTQIDHTDDSLGYNPCTIIKLAAHSGNMPIFQFFWRTFPNAANYLADYARFGAIVGNHLPVVKFLCNEVDLKQDPKTLELAISTAVRHRRSQIVAYLKAL